MDKLGIAYSFAAFARLAAAQRQLERAVILWGAAQHLGQTINLVLVPSREGPDKVTFTETRAQLGQEAFAAASAEGRTMKMQEAIAYALR